ncbi:D-2-hydroxyacid dehydrogenase [Salinispira pacifica]|uniref:D-2-hydroxyacid dehydrogenase n=1 Tax=Salinispira pacifica TaxID=1307761 RepID=UPI0011826F8D|nr:D-2-hydroxyacid dehydrogenase [Salinispira pacifica]
MKDSPLHADYRPRPAIRRILVVGGIAAEMEQLLPSVLSVFSGYRPEVDRDGTSGLRQPEFRFFTEGSPGSGDYDWADALAAFRPPPLFEPEKLNWIHALGAGVEDFVSRLQGVAGKDRPMLTRTTSVFGPIIAEYCLGHILADMQNHRIYARQQQHRQWKQHSPCRLADSRIFILGAGDIGSGIASVFTGMGCRVRGLARTPGARKGFVSVYTPEDLRSGSPHAEELGEVLARADIVINILPHTGETEGFMDEEFVSRLEGALFINAGRGSVIREDLLLQALNAGKIRRAVLDVFPKEPLQLQSPLWNREDVVITPHVAGLTGAEDALRVLFQRLEAVSRGDIREYVVDIPRGY